MEIISEKNYTELTKLNLKELINCLISFKFNRTTEESKYSILLKHFNSENPNSLLDFLIKEKERFNNDFNFEYYFGTLTIEENKYTPIDVVNVLQTNITIGGLRSKIILKTLEEIIKQKHRSFNFYNYKKLKEEKMLDLIDEFDTNFRGEIEEIIRFGKYCIIKTIKKK